MSAEYARHPHHGQPPATKTVPSEGMTPRPNTGEGDATTQRIIMEAIIALAAAAVVAVGGSVGLGYSAIATAVNNDAAWNSLPADAQNFIRSIGMAGGR